MAENNGHVSLEVDCDSSNDTSNLCGSQDAYILSVGDLRSTMPHGAIQQKPEIQLPEAFKCRALERRIKMSPQSSNSKPKIQKVTSLRRNTENFSRLFEPKVVSFGPIQHGVKHEYQEAEQYKEQWKKKFLQESGKKEELLYKLIIEGIEQLRNCFKDNEIVDNYSDEELAQILVNDGCAILYYIYCTVENKHSGLNMKADVAVFMEHDMFLLENQLPFQVLHILIGLTDHNKWMDRVKEFIRKVSLASYLKQEMHLDKGKCPSSQVKRELDVEANSEKDELPSHLLALLRESLFRSASSSEHVNFVLQDKKELPGSNEEDMALVQDKGNETDWESYRKVTELKESGISFMANKRMFLNDIDFTQHYICGTLKIPPITIDDSTERIFMNLIAYEMSPDFDNDFRVSTYIWFLDTLIDDPEDVKELRKAHILRNFLGCDEELSQLFNNIATDVVPNGEMFKLVRQGIQKHYDSKWRTNLAIFYNTHFTTPWSAIAFFAALLVFLITGVQAYCTFYSCNAK